MVYDPDTQTDQNQCDYGRQLKTPVFIEKKGGEDDTAYGIHKAVDGYAAYRVVFQKNTPDSVGSGGDKGQIEQQQKRRCAGRVNLPAHTCADDGQDDSAAYKLVSA